MERLMQSVSEKTCWNCAASLRRRQKKVAVSGHSRCRRIIRLWHSRARRRIAYSVASWLRINGLCCLKIGSGCGMVRIPRSNPRAAQERSDWAIVCIAAVNASIIVRRTASSPSHCFRMRTLPLFNRVLGLPSQFVKFRQSFDRRNFVEVYGDD